jgi:hypothetical protein
MARYRDTEIRIQALRDAQAIADSVYSSWWYAATYPDVRPDWESLADGAFSVRERIQELIEKEIE